MKMRIFSRKISLAASLLVLVFANFSTSAFAATPSPSIYDYYAQNGVLFYSANTKGSTCGGSGGNNSNVSNGSSNDQTTGTGGDWMTPGNPKNDTATAIVQFFASKGFSGPAIAGILSNASVESDMDVDPVPGGYPVGVFQVLSGKGLNPDATIQQQLDFMWTSYEGAGTSGGIQSNPTISGYSSLFSYMTGSDPTTAAQAWYNYLEVWDNGWVPGNPWQGAATGDIGGGLNYAQGEVEHANGVPGESDKPGAAAIYQNFKLSDGSSLSSIKGNPSKLGNPSSATNGSTSSSAGCSSSDTGTLVSGGMNQGQADSLMKDYYDNGTTYTSQYNLESGPFNCVAFSHYFISKFTNLKWGSGEGYQVVQNLASFNGGAISYTPSVYAIFSIVGYGDSEPGGWPSNSSSGHTGVILGIDTSTGMAIIGEANYGDTGFNPGPNGSVTSGGVQVREEALSNMTQANGWSFYSTTGHQIGISG